jgi:hypothetical protein
MAQMIAELGEDLSKSIKVKKQFILLVKLKRT